MGETREVLRFVFDDSGEIPNHRTLPVLVYKQAFDPGGPDPASAFESKLPAGGWRSAWRWGVYPFPHYHSTAHEVLGVYRGRASLRLGHSTGVTLTVEPGDVVVIPAGVGHQNLESSPEFHVAGGYPADQSPDLMRGLPGERPTADNAIASVTLPRGDPVCGLEGPIFEAWGIAG